MIYEFTPTQSYNGYDKPWAPGANANILALPVIRDTEMPSTFDLDDFFPIAAGDYVWRFTINANFRYRIYFCDAEGNYYTSADWKPNTGVYQSGSGWYKASDGTPGTYNIPISVHADCYVRLTSSQVDGSAFTDVMLVAGTTPPESYSPYANICMPEGFNIWDPDNAEYVQVYAGYVNANTRELYLRPVYQEYAGEELVGPWMSSMDEYTEEGTPTTGAFVIDFGGDLTSFEITPFMLQTLLDSLGIRQHFLDGAGLLNSLMDQAQGRVRSEDELLPNVLHVIPIGDSLPIGLHIRPISNDVLPGLPGKFIR